MRTGCCGAPTCGGATPRLSSGSTPIRRQASTALQPASSRRSLRLRAAVNAEVLAAFLVGERARDPLAGEMEQVVDVGGPDLHRVAAADGDEAAAVGAEVDPCCRASLVEPEELLTGLRIEQADSTCEARAREPGP